MKLAVVVPMLIQLSTNQKSQLQFILKKLNGNLTAFLDALIALQFNVVIKFTKKFVRRVTA